MEDLALSAVFTIFALKTNQKFMTEQITEAEIVKGPTFDKAKAYKWPSDEIFPLKGIELYTLKQILQALTSTQEAQHAIAAYEALKLVDNLIKEGVETGKIQEQEPTEPEQVK